VGRIFSFELTFSRLPETRNVVSLPVARKPLVTFSFFQSKSSLSPWRVSSICHFTLPSQQNPCSPALAMRLLSFVSKRLFSPGRDSPFFQPRIEPPLFFFLLSWPSDLSIRNRIVIPPAQSVFSFLPDDVVLIRASRRKVVDASF